MIETSDLQSLLYSLQWLKEKDSFEKSDVIDVLDEIFDILLKMNKMEHICSLYAAGFVVKENEE
jgi:hypothetical protein